MFFILSTKIRYYTKETLRFTNIIAMGILIFAILLLTKYKPTYAVYLKGEKIGYINDKEEFQDEINTEFFANEEQNIAYTSFETMPEYELKLIDKKQQTNEEQTLIALKEKSDITYFRYAIKLDGDQKEIVNTIEEAKQILNQIQKETNTKYTATIEKIYTKDINTIDTITIASNISEQMKQEELEKKEQEEKQKSSINGVYIAAKPVSGNITSRYGSRESIRDHTHKGLDIAAKTGTSIYAVADGKVTYSATMGGYGNLIIIDHGNGVETYYGHCSKLYANKGKVVKAGEKIAAVGSTGNSTGPHLHLEIRLNGVYVNPQKYLYQ